MEAEFRMLRSSAAGGPESTREALRQWLVQNGAALDAERRDRNQERERERALHGSNVRAETVAPADGVSRETAGVLETEYKQHCQAVYQTAEQRHSSLAEWLARNGTALAVEQAQRQSLMEAKMAEAEAQLLAERASIVQVEYRAGRIGPREAELLSLASDCALDREARKTALRAWLEKHTDELIAEVADRSRLPADETRPTPLASPPTR